MNNKGQTLVIFVILLPLFLFVFAYIVDTALMLYEKNKLDDLNKMVIDYKMYHVEENKEKIKEYIKRNDKEVIIKKLYMDEKKVEIQLIKKIDAVFGKIIGLNTYEIKSYYIGKIDKKEIKKIEE